MHYLIDGHNLIGKMPDIDLRDPDDEIQLVLRLKSWVVEQKNREATIIFDGGQIGGVSNRLSSRDLTVIFAPPGQIADTLIIRRLQSLKNPRQYTVISSDRMVLDAAKVVRVKALKSEEFIAREGFVYEDVDETAVTKQQQTPKTPPKPEDPLLSEAEVAEWLQLFGPVPERKPRPLHTLKGEPSPKKKKKKQPKPRTGAAFQQLAESENPELNQTEINEWLALFGPNPTTRQSDQPTGKSDKQKKKQKTSLEDAKRGQSKLSDADLAEWLAWFGED